MRVPLLSALLLFVFVIQSTAQDTWTVCYKGNLCDEADCDFYDIQSAINGSSSGDIIDVYEGNYAAASYCGSEAKAITIQGVCQECPDSRAEKRTVQLKKKQKVSSSSSKVSKVKPSSKSTKTKPVKKQKKKKPTTLPSQEAEAECDIFISQDGISLIDFDGNPDVVPFWAGLAFCASASGSTISNLKFLCSAPVAQIPADELGIGIYVHNTTSITIQENEFIGCVKGVVLDGASFSTVKDNQFQIVGATFPTTITYPLQTQPDFRDKWSSCNFVAIFQKNSPALPTSASFNVIEKNQGSLTASPVGGCAAFFFVTDMPVFDTVDIPPSVNAYEDTIQFNFLRRNQVVGIGSASFPRVAPYNDSIPGNGVLIGLYTRGSVQFASYEKNQHAMLSYDVFIEPTFIGGTGHGDYYLANIGHTIRGNKFIQTLGPASILLGDAYHSVTENEISVTQTTAVGVFIPTNSISYLSGDDYIVANHINVPSTPNECDVYNEGEHNSFIDRSGLVCDVQA